MAFRPKSGLFFYFFTLSAADPRPLPLRVQCRSSVPSLCLRSNFAPEGGQKATPRRLHSEATPTPKPTCQSETDRYALQCYSSDLTTTSSGKRQKTVNQIRKRQPTATRYSATVRIWRQPHQEKDKKKFN